MSLCSALFPWGGVSGWHEGAAGQQGLELGVTAVPTRPQCQGRWGRPSPNSVCGGGVGGQSRPTPVNPPSPGLPAARPSGWRRASGAWLGPWPAEGSSRGWGPAGAGLLRGQGLEYSGSRRVRRWSPAATLAVRGGVRGTARRAPSAQGALGAGCSRRRTPRPCSAPSATALTVCQAHFFFSHLTKFIKTLKSVF